jgi:Phage regulatory protein Rha (Phage_pRha)/ORF6C domain
MNRIELVRVDNEARVNTRDIAQRLGVQHASTLSLIDDYLEDFEAFGRVGFEIDTLATNGGKQKSRCAYLNEDQAYLLLTFTKNSPEARACKVALVAAFRTAREPNTLVTMNDPILMQVELIRQLRQDQLSLQDRTAALEAAMDATPINSVEVGQIYKLGQALARAIGGKYHVVWHEFKSHFQLASYRDLPRSRFLEGVKYLRDWYEKIRTGDELSLLEERAA